MIIFTARRMAPSGSSLHEHIATLQWTNPATNDVGSSDRETLVDWIRRGGDARVRDAQSEIRVGVVDASPPYLRTYSDGAWTNNLLSLPTF